jgi:hypothetical protein
VTHPETPYLIAAKRREEQFVMKARVLLVVAAIMAASAIAQAQEVQNPCAGPRISRAWVEWAEQTEMLMIVAGRPVPTQITEHLKIAYAQERCPAAR